MNTTATSWTLPRSTSRTLDHEARARALALLEREYPHTTVSERYDALIIAQFDLDTARGLIVQATLDGQSVSDYLAQLEAGKGEGRDDRQ